MLFRLARALQEEEDALTAQRHQDRERVRLPASAQDRIDGRTTGRTRQDRQEAAAAEGKDGKKDKKCVVM